MSANRCLAIVLVMMLVPAWAVAAPPAEEPTQQQPSYVAEVTAGDVYIRSGPSANYYPVIKLDAGSRVTVVDQNGDWLAVEPPDGCYSLIADVYVDAAEGTAGVVNGDNVRVRVGSQLQPEKNYAIQTKLSKGAAVEIIGHLDKIGDSEGGYYKIVPPAGAKLWISAEYLTRVPQELLALEAAATSEPGIVDTGAATIETAVEGTPSAPQAGDTTASPEPAAPAPSLDEIKTQRAEYRQRIDRLDADLKAELAKPLLRRDLGRIVEEFRPLAEQEIDEFARVYARTRIAQLEDMIEAMEAVGRVRQLGEQVKVDRQAALTARTSIRPALRPIREGFDVEGELRPSAIYNSSVGPRRYRLVTPGSDPVRTIAYVEIPPDSGMNINDYMGRIVGVRARETRLQTGDVDPITIYTANELVVLERADTAPVTDDR
ncbi:MAG TPA: hypothetical protein VM243_09155 [Phycisphaerae bacterium]|nr:hypothetical protein [Phycisphaerae bacterium]